MKSITKPQKKKCKGKSKHTVNKDIIIDDYRETLFSSTKTKQNKKKKKKTTTKKKKKKKKKKKMHSVKSIKSHNHMITSYKITKCSLSCFDDKRYILEDGITTLVYGTK